MTLSEMKSALGQLDRITFLLPDGGAVPSHFHVTEVGKISKHFIDCGGTVRQEEVASLQLWNANDYDHRLHSGKLMDIITLSQETLGMGDHKIEVEYQGPTIQKFGLEFDGRDFRLTTKQTDCLAKDKCGIPLEVVEKASPCCDPNGGCC